MRRVRIENRSHDLIVGFVAGVEWVNDSAIAVVALDGRGKTPFVGPGGPGWVRQGGGAVPHRQRHRRKGVVR